MYRTRHDTAMPLKALALCFFALCLVSTILPPTSPSIKSSSSSSQSALHNTDDNKAHEQLAQSLIFSTTTTTHEAPDFNSMLIKYLRKCTAKCSSSSSSSSSSSKICARQSCHIPPAVDEVCTHYARLSGSLDAYYHCIIHIGEEFAKKNYQLSHPTTSSHSAAALNPIRLDEVLVKEITAWNANVEQYERSDFQDAVNGYLKKCSKSCCDKFKVDSDKESFLKCSVSACHIPHKVVQYCSAYANHVDVARPYYQCLVDISFAIAYFHHNHPKPPPPPMPKGVPHAHGHGHHHLDSHLFNLE